MALPSFLGSGLVTPFRRDQKNDFANDSGLSVIKSCVAQALGVRADSGDGTVQGELPWRPEFGSRLYLLLHQRGRILGAFAEVYVREALARWEPRVVLTSIDTSFDGGARALTIRITYDVISKNAPGNAVFTGIEQEVSIPLAA